MTFAYWSVLLAALLPLIWAGVAKTSAPGYDNHKPRVFFAELTGRAQRANWAQANSYEAFPPFAAGVVIASLTGADTLIVDVIAGLFLVCRILHGIFYIQDKAMARTLVWTAGFFCVIGLFIAAAWTGDFSTPDVGV